MSRICVATVFALVLFAAAGAAAPLPPGAKPPAAGTELHVVAIYEGAPAAGGAAGKEAAVLVDRPDKEVTIVLSSYSPVTWNVTATPTTKLKKVILAGYHRQAATVPNGTRLEELFHEGRDGKPYLFVYYKLESPRFRPAVQALRELTKQEVRSFRGTYRFDPTIPLTVDGVQDDPRLASDYPRSAAAAELPKVQFRATYLTATGRFDVAASFGDFTQAGPDRGSLKPLPKDIRRLTYDPKGKKYYGLTMHEVHEVDLDKKTSTKIAPAPGTPEMSWPSAITFDTKQNRLLVVASKAISGYDPATGKWGVVAPLPRGTDLSALAYHEKDGLLYGLGQEFGGEDDGGRPVLYQMNAQGALLRATELPAPMFPGLLDRRSPGGRVQLVSAGGHLAAVLGGSAPRDESGKPGKAESFLFLIDPATDKVQLAWKE